MLSFQNWKAVRCQALNFALQQTQQTKSIYLTAENVKGWIKYCLWKPTDYGLIAEIIRYIYNFVEALRHQLSTMKTLCSAHSGVLFSFCISFKCQMNLAF